MKKYDLVKLAKKSVKYYLPVVVWALAIFSVSNGGVPHVSTVYWQDFIAHKTAHILEFGILGVLMFRALKQEKTSKQAVIWSIVFCIIYGMSDELHQRFTQGRESRFRDVIIDTIGASAIVIATWKLLPKAPKKLLIWAEKLELV